MPDRNRKNIDSLRQLAEQRSAKAVLAFVDPAPQAIQEGPNDHAEAELPSEPYIIEIPMDAIQIEPDFNLRGEIEQDEEFWHLVDDIKEHGLLHPPTVTPLGDGRWKLIAGFRRIAALKANGATSVTVHVIEADEITAKIINYAENARREDVPFLRRAQRLAELQAELGLGVRELARIVNESPGQVSLKLKLLKTPHVCSAIDRGEIGRKSALELLRLIDADGVEIVPGATQWLLDWISKNKPTTLQLSELIDQILTTGRLPETATQPRVFSPLIDRIDAAIHRSYVQVARHASDLGPDGLRAVAAAYKATAQRIEQLLDKDRGNIR